MSETSADAMDPRRMRASNDDRERVARILNDALEDGRLTPLEAQERITAVYAAKTLGDLEPLTEDLPGHTELVPYRAAAPAVPAAAPGSAVARVGGTPTSTFAVAIMSGATRKGAWVVPAQFNAVALMGGIDIDLTQARFASRDTLITAVTMWGGIDITVPDDITVLVSGIGLLGSFEDDARVEGTPGGPVVRINGLALMGAVDVHRKKTKKKSADEIES